MEQNTYSRTSKNLVALLTISMMVSSCSLLGTKQLEVVAKPMDRTIIQPIMPREIDLKQLKWFAVTSKNLDEFLETIEKQEGEVIFLAMSVPDYEVMSGNMQELKRYITEMKDVVVYYRTVTMPPKKDKS